MDTSPPATIRAATPADAAGIAAVHTQSWRETYTGLIDAAFLERMTNPAARERRAASWVQTIERQLEQVFVAEQIDHLGRGEVVAFASVGPARDHAGYDSELMTLYSFRRVQGQGLGKALLHAAAKAAGAGGAKNMALWVLAQNPTRGWYAAQGAREAGAKTDGDLQEIRMVWDDLAGLVG